MEADDPAVLDLLRRSMVARIATLSRGGRPSVTPLYFVHVGGCIWLGTVAGTLAVRNVRADPRVSVLFEAEPDRRERRVLRVRGRAGVRADRPVLRAYNLRVARKYVLTPGGIRDALAHVGQARLVAAYRAQAAERGRPCVIEVVPQQVGLLVEGDQPGPA